MKNTLRTIAICGLLVSPQLFCMNQDEAAKATPQSRTSKIGTAIKGAVWNKKTGMGLAVVATSAAAGIATYLRTKNTKYTAMAVAAIPAALGLAYLVYKSAPCVKSVSVKTFNGSVYAVKATGHGIVVAAKSPWTGIKKLSSMVGRLFAKRAPIAAEPTAAAQADESALAAAVSVPAESAAAALLA